MSAPDDKEPLFPTGWDWERYEPAVREQAAQCERFDRAGGGSLTKAEEHHIAGLMYDWAEKQERAGLLPSADEREKKGQPYKDIFAALQREAGDALNQNRAGKAGLAHWDLEKESERPVRPPRGRPGKGRDPDREL